MNFRSYRTFYNETKVQSANFLRTSLRLMYNSYFERKKSEKKDKRTQEGIVALQVLYKLIFFNTTQKLLKVNSYLLQA